MLKVTVKEKANYIENRVKGYNISLLEYVVLLDRAIELLKKDCGLSDDEIWEELKNYRNNLKEV